MTAINRGSDPAAKAEMEPARESVPQPVPGRFRARPQFQLSQPSSPLIAGIAVATILASVIFFWAWRSGLATGAAQATWFAGYVDVTVSPPYAFEEAATPGTRDVVLAFLVASPQDLCVASWGAAYGLDEANTALGLERRISSLRSSGGSAAVSFGGARNSELATTCQDEEKLRTAYRDVVERYEPAFIDFDLEGADLLDQAGAERRARAVAWLQGDRNSSGKELAVWLTLPASPRGLTDAGIAAVEQMLQAGVDLAGVNIMTMNYGASRSSSQGMLDAAKAAAAATHDQLGIVYQRTGTNLSREQVWKKIGLTPMIGRNDLPGEVFELDAARDLKDYAVELGIQRLSMWSLNRDATCPSSEEGPTASFTCSGVDQGSSRFSDLLGSGLPGRMG
ncbi:chitinase [Arthrobacter sp. PvP102]|uniref:chitinase n=1 Tax=unclassified Arthrobacter TaxID=235627 RepID=UPI001AE6B3D3|nr:MULTISPECIES: chitinase [unclassified Arthrobacter]MBP1234742.1 chitinase [Arthrobacter sp. PvP103]MBP1235700.1 chitinase [Arthrobacter sp. PvP102]